MASNQIDFVPIILHIVFCTVIIFALVFVSGLIGPKHKAPRKAENFECGLDPIGDARTPFHLRYFLIAILFVLFDIEVLFMYPWAVNFKVLGWVGFGKIAVFILLLIVGYLYIIKRKALEWEK